ncbi:MAG TPA: hypothetical protein VFA38_05940 [Nitrospirales bacterium]|nr:hypothetical protein [Nitrospirales bacterium]
MRCPHFQLDDPPETSRCEAAVTPFEPTPLEREEYCLSVRHRRCPLYASADENLPLSIRGEVARAIG